MAKKIKAIYNDNTTLYKHNHESGSLSWLLYIYLTESLTMYPQNHRISNDVKRNSWGQFLVCHQSIKVVFVLIDKFEHGSICFDPAACASNLVHAQKHQNRHCVSCICVHTCKWYMHHSMGYRIGNAISLFSWNQAKTRHCYLPLAIFVCLYQQNLIWYQQDPYIPTGAKLYLQNPKGTHTVHSMLMR